MSELKTFTFGLGQYTENGSPCVVAVDDEENPRLASDEKFYRKSEADKVIAEQKERYFELQDTAIKIDKELTETRKQLRHQKYKRCLAMAKLCAAERDIYNLTPKFKKVELYRKWRELWLKIAELFKETK